MVSFFSSATGFTAGAAFAAGAFASTFFGAGALAAGALAAGFFGAGAFAADAFTAGFFAAVLVDAFAVDFAAGLGFFAVVAFVFAEVTGFAFAVAAFLVLGLTALAII